MPALLATSEAADKKSTLDNDLLQVTLGLNEFAITEGGKAVWKNNSYIDGVAGVANARRDVAGVTFDIGSGRYRSELSGVKTP